MQIPKEQILQFLRSQGDEQKAQKADGELPENVDTEQHGGILQSLGIDPQALIGQLAGGGGLGDVGKKLGL